jgi:hypothetical protein
MQFKTLRDPETNEIIGCISTTAKIPLDRLFAALTDEDANLIKDEPDTVLEDESSIIHRPAPKGGIYRRAILWQSDEHSPAFAIRGVEGINIHLPSCIDINLGRDIAEEVEIVPAERKQAATVLVPHDSLGFGVHAVVCAKGRGVILPGGKVEHGESLADAAARELYEEVGLQADDLIPLFSSPVGPHDVTTFICPTWTGRPRSSSEGQAVIAPRDALLSSLFGKYYERVFKAFDAWNRPNA